MDFQVNDQTYFVSVGEDAAEWEVFVSTPTGARTIPVYNDAGEFEEDAPESILVEDKRRRKIVN